MSMNGRENLEEKLIKVSKHSDDNKESILLDE